MKVAQSCLTVCDAMDYTVHGILQARILEWVAFLFSRRSSQPRDQTQVSCIAGGFFTSWAMREDSKIWVTFFISILSLLWSRTKPAISLRIKFYLLSLWEFPGGPVTGDSELMSVWVQSLVRELRSHKPCKKKIYIYTHTHTHIFVMWKYENELLEPGIV